MRKAHAAAAFVFASFCADVSYAAGPYSYQGSGGEGDGIILPYQNVLDSQTQTIELVLNAGNAFLDGNMHFAIGGRGHPFDTELYGRGVILGYFADATNGCNGVAVEDFTRNFLNGTGVIAGTCIPLDFEWTTYKINVTISYSNVSYVLYARELVEYPYPHFEWMWVLSGGCVQTAGVSCPEYTPIDGNYGHVFAAAAFLDEGYGWSISNMYVNHK